MSTTLVPFPAAEPAAAASWQRHAAPRGAVVVGGDYTALGVVRSLGRRGIDTWVVPNDGHLVAIISRYARRCRPLPRGDEAGQVRHLLDLCAEHDLQGCVLFPTYDGV